MEYIKREHIEFEVEDILNITAQSLGVLPIWNKYRNQPYGYYADLVNKDDGCTHLVVSEDTSYHGSPIWELREDVELDEATESKFRFLINLKDELKSRHATRVICEWSGRKPAGSICTSE